MITKFKIFEAFYVTHDNGGNPFAINDDGKYIDFFKNVKQLHRLSWKNDVKKIFSGDKLDDNSSVLIQLKNNKYMFIGHEIYEFESDEKITEYYSRIGNSDVPYPLALSKNYVYLMLEKIYIDKKEFPKDIDWRDPYTYYYENEKNFGKNKFKNLKIIDKNRF